MSERVIVRGPGEGRTLLVGGGGDRVTCKARSAETDGATSASRSRRRRASARRCTRTRTGSCSTCSRASTSSRSSATAVHQPAALEEFFEEFGVPVDGSGADHAEPPEPAAMIAALERNGVHVVGAPT
jgi:hypothetical protein